MNEGVPISTDELLKIIGSQVVTVMLLRQRITELEALLKEKANAVPL
jgi:hypothetical protein